MNVKSLQQTLDQLDSGEMSLSELMPYVRHEAAAVRAKAIETLGRLNPGDERSVVRLLKTAAQDPVNHVTLMGTITVAHVAVASLLRIGSSASIQAANELLAGWPEPEREDLHWYLESEGLLTESPARH